MAQIDISVTVSTENRAALDKWFAVYLTSGTKASTLEEYLAQVVAADVIPPLVETALAVDKEELVDAFKVATPEKRAEALAVLKNG